MSAAFLSPALTFASTSRTSLVPRYAVRPPLPRTMALSSSKVYSPEQHTLAHPMLGSPPARSGEKVPSSSVMMSAITPLLWRPMLMPPPK